jgi:hypothetical protein
MMKALPPDEFGITGKTAQRDWRPTQGIGTINGIPTFTGKALATNGILVIIARPCGDRVIGHLESFKVEKTGAQRSRAKKVDVNEGRFE